MPALKPKEFAEGEKLMPIADLPTWAQPAFNGMQTLNRVQSRVADMALFGVDNMLLCAPTGAGKTNVAMLAILHELGQNMNEDGTINLANFKVVYVAPMKVSCFHDPCWKTLSTDNMCCINMAMAGCWLGLCLQQCKAQRLSAALYAWGNAQATQKHCILFCILECKLIN